MDSPGFNSRFQSAATLVNSSQAVWRLDKRMDHFQRCARGPSGMWRRIAEGVRLFKFWIVRLVGHYRSLRCDDLLTGDFQRQIDGSYPHWMC